MLSMNSFFLNQKTPNEINLILAERLVARRKQKKMSQTELSKKSGVSFGSLKRFEQKGEISLLSFSKLVIALNADDELLTLFEELPPDTIQEIIDGQS